MKILTLHSDYITFEPKKKALKNAEEVEAKPKTVKECLVVLTAVEKRDEANPEAIVKRLVKEVSDIAGQVKTDSIVLYPYAHLSSSLALPDKAAQILKDAENELSKKFKVARAPFGWYKSFEVKCKGHPLAELSREFGAEEKEENVSAALKAEKELKSFWYIIDVDGKLHEVDKFNYKGHDNLKKFAYYEKAKVRAVTQEPDHVKLMRKLELVDYEPASDSGHFRYYPKGRLIKSLLENYVTQRVVEYGGVEVETPIMYDMAHPALANYLQKFPARQYQIESDKRRFFLRFSACFGQFLMAHDATLSYKNLPLRLYELTRYSFRREQSGELTGLRRLRAFTMPDVHALCTDIKQAMEEYKTRFKLCVDVQEKIGLTKDDFELAVRVTEDFYNKNKEFVTWLVKSYGKPALIEMWKERTFYFILKYELNFVDNLDKASALSTDQIDVENGERYDIKFAGKDGKNYNPIILHCSPSGAIERVIYALLEKAARMEKAGKVPSLPVWLSPTHVRFCAVSDAYNDLCEKLADELAKEEIRTDVDDRTESIGRKIRDAEKEWVPLIAVVGQKEADSGKLQVRVREEGVVKTMTKDEVKKWVKERTKGMPFKPLSLPKLVSKRPAFVG